jgi:hypothetical protein
MWIVIRILQVIFLTSGQHWGHFPSFSVHFQIHSSPYPAVHCIGRLTTGSDLPALRGNLARLGSEHRCHSWPQLWDRYQDSKRAACVSSQWLPNVISSNSELSRSSPGQRQHQMRPGWPLPSSASSEVQKSCLPEPMCNANPPLPFSFWVNSELCDTFWL